MNVPHRKQSVGDRAPFRCFTAVEKIPGTQADRVRNPSSGVSGWLQRIQDRLARHVNPKHELSSHIRGNVVAVDYIFDALLEHRRSMDYAFVIGLDKRPAFIKWAEQMSGKISQENIHTFSEVAQPGMDRLRPDIWLSLMGNGCPGLKFRQTQASRLFPTVGLLHGLSDKSDLSGSFLQSMLMPTYEFDSLICTSKSCGIAIKNIFTEIASNFEDSYGAKISFNGRIDHIPLCVDIDKYKPADKKPLREKLRLPSEAIILLYVGYISLVKADLLPVLPMFRQLVRANPDVNLQFVIAGTGDPSYGKCLDAVVRELGLQNNVTQLREVSEATKRDLYAAADVFVGPCESLQESFGLTPVEAMASGLPQVVADWDGYRDTVVHRETGFLVPTRWGRCDGDLAGTHEIFGWSYDHTALSQAVHLDTQKMREYLQLLIESQELRHSMSVASRSRALSEFSYSRVSSRYEGLFLELIDISHAQQTEVTKKRFDQGAYFRFFGHFATHDLTDDVEIRTIDKASAHIPRVMRGVKAGIKEGITLFDEDVLRGVIAVTDATNESKGPACVGYVISEVSSQRWHRDLVRRHILFLIKHGLLLC